MNACIKIGFALLLKKVDGWIGRNSEWASIYLQEPAANINLSTPIKPEDLFVQID